MVLVEEVPEEQLHAGEHESDFESDNADSGSEASFFDDEDDDEDILNETVYERLAALKDIIPPTTRTSLSSSYRSTKSWLGWSFKKTGTVAWILTTSALLVGLPLALAIEDETRVMQQEKEMQMQNAGQQQLLGGPQPGQAQGVLPPGF
ncbi:hypothetical protein P7C73_g6277, partial [Tremellales sp. Uapishka_1]